MFLKHFEYIRYEIAQQHSEELEMIDYDPDDMFSVECVQNGVMNLDAVPANGMHKPVEGVLRYLLKIQYRTIPQSKEGHIGLQPITLHYEDIAYHD